MTDLPIKLTKNPPMHTVPEKNVLTMCSSEWNCNSVITVIHVLKKVWQTECINK